MTNDCRIKKIEIKNIKGFENYLFSPSQYLIPNKPNLFVAPNGFGKSSITTAFNSLLKTKIKLSPLEYREQNFDYKPYLSIITSDEHGNDEHVFYADENKNTINDVFEIEVINSPLKAKKKSLGGGNSYAVIDIEPLIIWNTIPIRFNELQRYLNMISHKTLSNTLKELEKDNLIIKKDYKEIPPRVEYSLSDKGKSFIPILYSMCEWGEKFIK